MAINEITPGHERYDELRAGFNTATEHTPIRIVEARTARDIVNAVRAAARQRHPVAIMNTGHGPSRPARGGVLIRTALMNGVRVDPVRRTATIQAGARWHHVLEETALHGLAPLCGSSPDVGAVGYTLGGGVGPLGRRFGFAADSCPEVISTYLQWANDVPEEVASSFMLLRYPNDPAIPGELRGRHVTHIRCALSGPAQDSWAEWIAPFRHHGGLLLDTVELMAYRAIGRIHHEPTDHAVAAHDRNILLRSLDPEAVTTLLRYAGPDEEPAFLVEVRAWGGALARPATVPNVVIGRDAGYSLTAISSPEPSDRRQRDALLEAMKPWGTGKRFLNFSGVDDTSSPAVWEHHRDEDVARLASLKAAVDPTNAFRTNFNIPVPGAPADRPAQSRHGALDSGD